MKECRKLILLECSTNFRHQDPRVAETQARMYTYTHTLTHIYVYIYIYIQYCRRSQPGVELKCSIGNHPRTQRRFLSAQKSHHMHVLYMRAVRWEILFVCAGKISVESFECYSKCASFSCRLFGSYIFVYVCMYVCMYSNVNFVLRNQNNEC